MLGDNYLHSFALIFRLEVSRVYLHPFVILLQNVRVVREAFYSLTVGFVVLRVHRRVERTSKDSAYWAQRLFECSVHRFGYLLP